MFKQYLDKMQIFIVLWIVKNCWMFMLFKSVFYSFMLFFNIQNAYI